MRYVDRLVVIREDLLSCRVLPVQASLNHPTLLYEYCLIQLVKHAGRGSRNPNLLIVPKLCIVRKDTDTVQFNDLSPIGPETGGLMVILRSHVTQ